MSYCRTFCEILGDFAVSGAFVYVPRGFPLKADCFSEITSFPQLWLSETAALASRKASTHFMILNGGIYSFKRAFYRARRGSSLAIE